jgi:hypothetical protein
VNKKYQKDDMLEIILILRGVEKLLIIRLVLGKNSLENPRNKNVSYAKNLWYTQKENF